MATIKQCDRCGIKIEDGRAVFIDLIRNIRRESDICPRCMDKLINFIEKKDE